MIPRKKLVDPSVHVRDARLYVLVVEGSETEPAYFEALKQSDLIPKHRVVIQVIRPDDHKTAPRHLVNNAEQAIAAIGNRMPDDECWLVFDVDHRSGSNRMQQIYDALDVARNQGWLVALSNPCFEVWLLLHITDDLAGIDDFGEAAENKLRYLLGGYNKSNVPQPCMDLQAIQLAMTRAKARDTDPKSPIPELAGTRVYRLMERLIGSHVA